MRPLFLLLLAAGLLGAAPALRADSSAPAPAGELSQSEIAERVAALLAAARAEDVRDPLEHARLALSRAGDASRAGNADAQQRAVDIARAALALAEARAALARERALLAAAVRRGREALRRNATGQALLESTKARASEAPAVGQDAGAGR